MGIPPTIVKENSTLNSREDDPFAIGILNFPLLNTTKEEAIPWEEKYEPVFNTKDTTTSAGMINRSQKVSMLKLDLKIEPGKCETCPAGAKWNYLGTGRWCFHDAYFLGKSGSKKKCETVRNNCPLGESKEKPMHGKPNISCRVSWGGLKNQIKGLSGRRGRGIVDK